MRSILNRTSLTVIATCALVACSGDSPTAVQAPSTLDAAWAQLALPSVSGFVSSIVGVPSVAELGGPVPPACAYVASSKSFTCATVTANGVTITRGYTLYDVSGNAQSEFDAKTTASIRTISSVKGTLTGLQGTSNALTIDESQDMTLSGLLGSDRVLNGTSSGKISTTVVVNGSSQTVMSTQATTYDKVTVPATATASAYPKSGSISSDVTTTVGSDAVHTQFVMTFNGTSKVTVVFTVNGHSTTCVMDTTGPGSLCS